MTNPQPKVGIVYRLTNRGGVQSCVLSLIRGLNAQGITPDLMWDVPPSPQLLSDARAQAGYHKIPYPVPTRVHERLPLSLRYLSWIANAVQAARCAAGYDFIYSFWNGFLLSPDIPHVYYLSGPPLLPQLERTPEGVKGWPIRFFRGFYDRFLKERRPVYEFHRDCRYVINSHYTCGLFREAHGVTLPVVHPAIDLAGRRFEDGDLARRDSILFFSRIIGDKRPELFLELAARHPQFRVVVMGGVSVKRRGYFDGLRNAAAARGLRAEFLDNPDNACVAAELARAKYYIFPAINEHFGMTTPEVIASGVVPFVHDSGGQCEIVPDQALRFTDSEAADKFARLVSRPDSELNGIRHRLQQHVMQYSENEYNRKMLGFLNEELRGKGAALPVVQ